MSALAAHTVVAVALALGGSTPSEDRLSGVWDCTAVTGNRGLTVSVDAGGRVGACRWPSPSQWDQVDSPGAIRGQGASVGWGLMWGVRAENQTTWLAGDPADGEQHYRSSISPAIHTVHRFADGASCEQDTFVLARQDILATRLRLKGFDAAPEVYWYANFSPCTRSIPGAPGGDWLLDSLNDFATFLEMDGRTVCHFRPASAGVYEHEYARELVRIRAKATAWTTFGDGVWIAERSLEPAAVHCGPDHGDKRVQAQAEAGWLALNPSASGQCASVMAIRPTPVNEGWEAVVYTAFGASRDDALDRIASVSARPFEEVLGETEKHWGERIGQAVLPPTVQADVIQRSRRALLTLMLCTGRDNPATVRAPGGRPLLACDWPRHGVWATEALARAGLANEAMHRVDLYASLVRNDPKPGKPEGSMPAAVNGDGTDSMPGLALDVEAPAWFLWSLERHVRRLDGEARTEYLARVWDAVDMAAGFLAAWTDSGSGEPLPSFDPAKLRDDRTDRLVLAVCTGMRSAVELASLAGRDRPEWRARARELEPCVRARCLDPDGSWKAAHPLMWWATRVIPHADDRWIAALDREVARLGELEGILAARSLYTIGACLEARPELTPQARTGFREALRRVMPDSVQAGGHGGIGPDALHSVLCFLAAAQYWEAETRLVELTRRKSPSD
ncbi:MAG: hypothetical protein GY851_25120 [bacterium]|nr:hypothetical protein [bacterium]